jgi:hypothetical protein
LNRYLYFPVLGDISEMLLSGFKLDNIWRTLKNGERLMADLFKTDYFIRCMLPGKKSRRQYRVDEIVGDQAALTEMWRQDSDRSWVASNNPQAVDISGLSGVEIVRAQAPAPGSFDED